MAPELKYKIAIIGGGPAGCLCAYFLKQKGFSPVIFEKSSPLKTLLPTGGGRCNLAYFEFDIKELVQNYPRGEKFLYSVFSQFATAETIDYFEKIGVKTYVQDDMRVFPISDKSFEVRKSILESISGIKIINENIISLKPCKGGFEVRSEKGAYFYEKVVLAIGGHSAFEIIKGIGHTIIPPCPALTALKTKENFTELSGVSIKSVKAGFNKKTLSGDILFTHKGISGPLVYKISSLMAREKFPYEIIFDFVGEINLQEFLDRNSHKTIKNVLSDFVPKSFARFILSKAQVDENIQASKIDGKTRDKIYGYLNNYKIEVTAPVKDGEVVTCGGVALDEVNAKTMESKVVKNLYFCGEVLDIDGFCGGFNLQNCWSTGFVAANGIAMNP